MAELPERRSTRVRKPIIRFADQIVQSAELSEAPEASIVTTKPLLNSKRLRNLQKPLQQKPLRKPPRKLKPLRKSLRKPKPLHLQQILSNCVVK